MQQREEFLSESHRIKEKVREKFAGILALFFAGLFGYLLLGYFLREHMILPEDRAKLELIQKYRSMSDDRAYLQRLKRAEEEIKSRYPVVVSPFQAVSLLRSPASKLYKALGLVYVFLPLFATLGLGLYIRRLYDRAGEEIFYQKHALEKELYRKDPDYPYFTEEKHDWEKLLDVKKVLELYAYVGNLSKEEYENLRDVVHLARDVVFLYAESTMPITFREEKFRAIVYFLLWHYGMCLYGNVPVGYISQFIKDGELKTALSLYQRRRVNTTGEELSRKVLMVLAYCHRDNGLYEIFRLADPLREAHASQ